MPRLVSYQARPIRFFKESYMSSEWGLFRYYFSKQTEGYLSEPTMCLESAAGYGIRVVLFPSDHLNLDL
jgi:hypothetical protein